MDRRQLAEECERIEKDGGSVRDYLAARGCISPWGTWYRLQKEELGRHESQITDGKGGDDVRKLTLEQKKKAVEIAAGGGNPLEYLKQCGAANPSASWVYILKCLEKTDPEKYAKIKGEPATTCCARSTRKGVEVPDECPDFEPKENEEPKPLDGGGWEPYPLEKKKPEEKLTVAPVPKPVENLTIKAEDLKKAMEEPETDTSIFQKQTGIALDDDFRIYGLKTKIGDFQAAGGNLCWYKSKQERVSMPVEDWKKILEIVPKVMSVMGL